MAVYEREDSRFWWIQLEGSGKRFSSRIPIGEDGSRRDSRAQAEDIYRAAMGDAARGRFVLPKDRPARTFREHAAWYRDTIDAQHKGHKRGKSMIAALVRYFADRQLHTIEPGDIEAWKIERAKEVARPTVNRELDILKPLLRSATPKYIETSPAEKVYRFRVPQFTPITVLTEDAEERMLKVATTEERAVLVLALDTLIRMGDCRQLRRSDDHGTYLEIPNPKTGQAYKVPVSARLRVALDAQPDTGSPYYFSRVYGKKREPISPVTMHNLFVDLCKRAKVPNGRKIGGVTFHSLRHTGASRAARHVKLSVVKRLGNWASLVMLDRYDHPDDPDLLRAVEAIGSRASHAGSVPRGTFSKARPK